MRQPASVRGSVEVCVFSSSHQCVYPVIQQCLSVSQRLTCPHWQQPYCAAYESYARTPISNLPSNGYYQLSQPACLSSGSLCEHHRRSDSTMWFVSHQEQLCFSGSVFLLFNVTFVRFFLSGLAAAFRKKEAWGCETKTTIFADLESRSSLGLGVI